MENRCQRELNLSNNSWDTENMADPSLYLSQCLSSPEGSRHFYRYTNTVLIKLIKQYGYQEVSVFKSLINCNSTEFELLFLFSVHFGTSNVPLALVSLALIPGANNSSVLEKHC